MASKGWRLLQVAEISDRFPRRAPVVSARVRQAAQAVHRTRPEETFRVPPDTVSMSFRLEWRDSWVMTDVVVIE